MSHVFIETYETNHQRTVHRSATVAASVQLSVTSRDS